MTALDETSHDTLDLYKRKSVHSASEDMAAKMESSSLSLEEQLHQ